MDKKYIFLLLNILAVAIFVLMYRVGHETLALRLIVPGLVLLVLIITIIVCDHFSANFKIWYRVSRRNYFKKKKEKTVVPVSAYLLDVLQKLPSDFIVINRYEKMSAEIDYVVIGRTGIFLINGNDMKGKLEIAEKSLILDGKVIADKFIDRIRTNSRMMESDFKTFNKRKNLLKPVVCFTNAEVSSADTKMFGDVLMVSKDDINEKIEAYPHLLESGDISGIATFLKKNAHYLSCRNAKE
jgi:hypothetical protein